MTGEARLMSGIILITVPTFQHGGYVLRTSLMDTSSGYMENPLPIADGDQVVRLAHSD